jgi:hypothetical protein
MTTAVEYLVKEIIELTGVNIEMDEPIIEQAKKMEKEQIVQSIIDTIVGSNKTYDKEYPEVRYTAEQYYNETFGKKIVTEYRDGSIDVETYKSE